MKKLALFFALILCFSVFAVNIPALPQANKCPFYDYEKENISDWWESVTDNKKITIPVSSFYEFAIIIYVSESATITDIQIKCPSKVIGLLFNKALTSGFYIIYGAIYKTDDIHAIAYIYDDKLQEVAQASFKDQASGGSSYVWIYLGEGEIYLSQKVWVEELADGESPKYTTIFEAYEWINPNTEEIKIIYINSTTSPASVQVYNSSGLKFYEQGFNENETTYIFANDTKITIFAYGPADSKSLDITENGLWIVELTSELTDIYLNSTTTQEENIMLYWLNCTVEPSTYKIEYWNSSGLLASGIGKLEKQYPANSIITVKVFSEYGYKKDEFNITLDRDYVLILRYPSTTEYYTVIFKTYDAETNEEIVNAKVYINNYAYEPFKEIRLREGSYNVKITAEGYATAEFAITVKSNMTIPVYISQNASSPYIYLENQTIPEPEPPSTTEDWYGLLLINNGSSPTTVYIYFVKAGWGKEHKVLADTVVISAGDWIAKAWTESEINGYLKPTLGEAWSRVEITTQDGKTFTVSFDDCKNKYYAIYVYTQSGSTVGIWGTPYSSTSTQMFTGDFGQLLAMLLPVLLIVMLMGIIREAVRRR